MANERRSRLSAALILALLPFWPFLSQASGQAQRPAIAWYQSEVPFESVGASGLKASADLQFLRLTLYLSQPLAIRQLEMEACSGIWKDGVSVALNMGEWVVRSEGGTPRLAFAWSLANVKSRTVQSLTIGFRYNQTPCFRALRVLDAKGQMVPLLLGSGLPSLRVEPVSQRTEWRWGGAHETSDGAIDGALVWYGDRPVGDREGRSIGELMLMGSDRTVKVPVRPGLHYVPIDPPHTSGVVAARSSLASDLQGLVLLSPNRAEVWRGQQVPYRAPDKGVLRQLLFRDLVAHEGGGPWVLRLRSDGSFYIRGEDDRRGVGRLFGAVGTYQVLAENERSTRLQLTGHRLKGRSDADIPACAEDCLPRASSVEREVRARISEEIEIESSAETSQFMLRNRSPRSDRELDFTDMRIRIGHADR